jgi:hypothetical protein
MAGLKHLSDIYSKKGKDFLNDLFNKKLVVSEKPDGSILSMQDNGDGPLFYKRDDRQAISKLDRTIISLYEPPIAYLTKVANRVNLPKDLRFGFEYFQNTNPVSIAYDKLPKNGLVLTHMKQVNDAGKVTKFIDDPTILKKWAKKVGVEEPFIIFDGKLSKEQKEKLVEFLETPFEDLVTRFNTSSFTRYIVSILDPSLKNTALNNTLDTAIEGLVFKFNDGEVLAKVVDPVFTQAAKDKAKDRASGKNSSDEFGLILNSFIDWVESNNMLGSVLVDGDTEEEKYIELMTQLTKQYISKNKAFLDGVKIEKPEFAKAADFKLNTNMIRNKEVVDFIKKNPANEDLFKMLLSGFRKIRVRNTNVIDDNLKTSINRLVNNIRTLINTTNEGFLSFKEWKASK